MGFCVHCKSHVPFNTDKCLICEADIPAQNTPMANVKLASKNVCTACGTGNAANMERCITCEFPLMPTSFVSSLLLPSLIVMLLEFKVQF